MGMTSLCPSTHTAYIYSQLVSLASAKSGYVRHNAGWFSDQCCPCLASGRPVILRDTGFSQHLPCGWGLFAGTEQAVMRSQLQ